MDLKQILGFHSLLSLRVRRLKRAGEGKSILGARGLRRLQSAISHRGEGETRVTGDETQWIMELRSR